MKASDRGIELIKQFEGLRLNAYLCPAGVPTIGVGHTAGVKLGDRITQKEAIALLRSDLERFEAGVTDCVKVPIAQNQFDALCCLAFNIGLGAFRNSTVLKLLNQGDYQGAADRILWWTKSGGKDIQGLVRRRKAERSLFLGSKIPCVHAGYGNKKP